MLKTYIIFTSLFVSLLGGCSMKFDEHRFYDDSTEQKGRQIGIRKDLSELEEPYDNFDYSSVISKYAAMLPQNVSITRYKYYVIFSTLKPEDTYALINSDIKNTIDAMINSYINVAPTDVIPIVLFEDFNPYRDFAVNNFGMVETDLSPYGFYKISKNAIVIRYVSWKGSIPHEITHSFIQYDFPECPSWFNEGMASLHEKSTFKNGELIGEFSWRILSIRRAMNENTYTSLETMMRSNDEELYGKRTSFYYAQARYLLMYLQEKGLLKTYYRSFRDSYNEDNSGITQLEKLTGMDLQTIDKELLTYMNSFKE